VDSLSRSSSPLVRSPSLFSRVARPPATRLPPLCRSARRPPPGERPFCLPRPRSTLRPVIKQPRGGQIESVQETRERRRRGDGQLAATMVSIVKGPSWCSRADIGARPKPDRMRGQNAGRPRGRAAVRLAYYVYDGYIPGLESHPVRPPESPGRVRRYGPPPIASSFHRSVVV